MNNLNTITKNNIWEEKNLDEQSMNSGNNQTYVPSDIITKTKILSIKNLCNDIGKLKTCKKCKIPKSISNFIKNVNGTDGLNSICKECDTERKRKWYKLNHHRIKKKHINNYYKNIHENRKRSRLYYKKHKNDRKNHFYLDLPTRFYKWKHNAKYRKIPFTLKYEDIQNLPLICYYTGKELVIDVNKFNTVSLDRLDSLKGYTNDNVVLCCSVINAMKRDLSYQEFIKTCVEIANYKK